MNSILSCSNIGWQVFDFSFWDWVNCNPRMNVLYCHQVSAACTCSCEFSSWVFDIDENNKLLADMPNRSSSFLARAPFRTDCNSFLIFKGGSQKIFRFHQKRAFRLIKDHNSSTENKESSGRQWQNSCTHGNVLVFGHLEFMTHNLWFIIYKSLIMTPFCHQQ